MRLPVRYTSVVTTETLSKYEENLFLACIGHIRMIKNWETKGRDRMQQNTRKVSKFVMTRYSKSAPLGGDCMLILTPNKPGSISLLIR